MKAITHPYSYRRASEFGLVDGRPRLSLATSGLDGDLRAQPRFFEGRLRSPRKTADLLLAVAAVVRARFHTPPGMVQRLVAEADPVITSESENLRFEGFSSCCGVYARADLLPGSVDCDWRGAGTTNVDFNAEMRAALAGLSGEETVDFGVGADEFVVERSSGAVIERKVDLPHRWLRGLAEVQAIQPGLEQRFELRGPEILRFLRAMPKNARSGFVVAHGRSLRLSQVASRSSVFVAGLERLRVLQSIAHHAQVLAIHGRDDESSCAFVLDCGDCRFTLVLSPSVWRGFSGEGQLLHDLAAEPEAAVTAEILRKLSWESSLTLDALVESQDSSDALRALNHLAVKGQVGFDLAESRWFKRLLPFAPLDLEDLNPRIRSARELVDEGSIRRLAQQGPTTKYEVTSTSTRYQVSLGNEEDRCTCPWFVKHRDERGPCKHILAARISSFRSRA